MIVSMIEMISFNILSSFKTYSGKNIPHLFKDSYFVALTD